LVESDCPFCAIVAGKSSQPLLVEAEHSDDFPDINPSAPVHVLVVPRVHLDSAADLGPEHAEVLSDMFATIKAVAEKEGVAGSGYRVVTNIGDDAGQVVKHLHFHVVGGRPLGRRSKPGGGEGQ
jgi:histidine triad (HIT) family protein